ncbi:extensin isoform X3 [Nasonia vitripennis]|uniref:KH homology domain-containing protein 4 n=1 Tax=Nasonia vitripennis TaxID=7425 RepID=A0A7M7Q4N5_NASVI|nr:extensin isoform X3 [Nasonia vitripennis]
MKKGANAGIRMNSLHVAKAKLKTMDGNNKLMPNSNGGYKGTEMYTTEFEINETPPSARTLLTKGYIQDEINSFSGATVSTRGRFMTEQEKARCPHERPLYLYIQGHTKHNIDLAVQKINDIIKTEHRSSLNRPSRFTNAPPPLMSLHSGVPSEKICVGIENAPQGFDLRGRIVGAGGANLLYIRGETGATVTLRGRGSQFVDPALGTESPEPLHLCIEHPNPVALQNAKQLAINLIQTMQSELQSYIQQQPPPVQSQQVIQQPSMQQIQQAQFQTMNIGTLGQPNVVTIHQDMIQHPQSSVVSLPATIITATVAGGPGPGHPIPTGVHVPAPQGPMPPTDQPQVQLIGPPPGMNQVQYQIHPGQQLQIQGMPPPGSQNSPQPMTQMYVMSQPPPQQNFMSSSAPINGAVSYVYTQPRPTTPSQSMIEAVNVNLQQPPPSGPMNMNQQPPPPPSLMHMHFPPPFPPNQPPPPISQTYQIQYHQPVQTTVAQGQTQFVIQHGGEHGAPPPQQMQQNHEPPPQGMAPPPPQHMPPQFDGQPPPQMQIHGPPPVSQGYMVPTSQAMPDHNPPLPPPGSEMQHPPDGPVDPGMPPQPVPPPQMVPPPSVNQIQHSMNILTSVPPPSHPPPQAAPWLYQGQPMPQPPQGQIQVQMPPTSVPHHGVPPPEMQPQLQYHPQQVHYQNGQMQSQMHYPVQPPQPQPHFDQTSDIPDHHKGQGVKRRFSDVDGAPEPLMHQMNRPPTQRHGTGRDAGEQQQQQQQQQQHLMHGPPGAGATLPPGERAGGGKQLLMPPPYPDERRNMGQQFAGHNPGCEQPMNGEHGRNVGPGPPPPPPVSHPMGLQPGGQTPWQGHYARYPPNRPPPMPREGEQHHMPYHGAPPPPINMPPPQMRLVQGADGSRSPSQSALPDHPVSAGLEYNHMQPPYTTMKPPAPPPPPSAIPLVQSICNPPPPPPSPPTYTQSRQQQQGGPRGPPMQRYHNHHHPHHHHQPQHHHHPHHHHQVPVSQSPPTSAPPWMN